VDLSKSRRLRYAEGASLPENRGLTMANVRRFRPSLRRVCGAIALAAAWAIPATSVLAQQGADDQLRYSPADQQVATDWSDEIPAHVAAIDGTLLIEREGATERAEENALLLAGDRLRTDRARAEVLFGDGSALAIDQESDLDLLSESLIRMSAGRVRLLVARGALDYRVDAAGTSATLRAPGEYEVTVDDRGVNPEVRVLAIRGTADFGSPVGDTLIRAGFESRATATRYPSTPYSAIVASMDAFDRWVDDQHRDRSGLRSAQYLPDDLRIYSGAFDRDGEWLYERGYGYVWYPRVGVDWQPYYDGRWANVGRYGWTWIGAGAWTWPTHHYGRWGVSGTRWFWVPERRWAPAWVAWAGTPGYVSWCPLGYDNRPVFSVGVLYASSPWRGWTVVPSTLFVSSFAVRSHAVAPRAHAFSNGARFAVRGAPNLPSGSRAGITGVGRPAVRGVTAPRVAASRSSGQPVRAAAAARPSAVAESTTRRWDPSSVQRLGGAARVDPVAQPPTATFSRTPRERVTPSPSPAQSVREWGARRIEPAPRPAAPERTSRAQSRVGNGVVLPGRGRPATVAPAPAPQPQRSAAPAPGPAPAPAAGAPRSSEGRHPSAGAEQTGRRAGRR